ncbi:hypothetical protein [Pseudomonas cichorii]|uniref:hypothetical protein n=1 Tax=Pseudomonas cichorii TaxID=36746 RepID=UPI001C8AB524|nr:hypothetical protein [Pseudomonas cichorii]MBX8496931.1 hypothetical protein [Pseudomonas cichorii]
MDVALDARIPLTAGLLPFCPERVAVTPGNALQSSLPALDLMLHMQPVLKCKSINIKRIGELFLSYSVFGVSLFCILL